MTRARSRLTDGDLSPPRRARQDAPAPAPAASAGEFLPPPAETPLRRPDTPARPAGSRRTLLQGRLYRDDACVLRAAPGAVAEALDSASKLMPPPPPFPGARHGIAATDGRRDGTRTPKIHDENVARLIDVFRLWKGVNAKAECATRLPWSEAFSFVASRGGFAAPAPASSEALKDRIRAVARAMAQRRGLDDAPTNPSELVDFFGGALTDASAWMGAIEGGAFPYERVKAVRSRAALWDAFDEAFEEEAADPAPAPSAAPETVPTPRATPRARAPPAVQPARRAEPSREAREAPTREAPRWVEAEQESVETLVKKEKACLKEGKVEEARALQARRLGLGDVVPLARPCSLGLARSALDKGNGWPPSTQYLQKADVGGVIAAWRKLVPILLYEPEKVGHVAALVERIAAAFATVRTLKPEGIDGRSREEIRIALVEACEKGAFTKFLREVESLNETLTKRARKVGAASVAERKLRIARTAAKQTTNPRGISAAMMLLESEGCAPATLATFEKLVALTPKARQDIDEDVKREVMKGARERLFCLDPLVVKKTVKTAPRGKTKDLSGLRFEHLQNVLTHGGEFAVSFLTLLFEQIGRNPACVGATISRARSVGVPKKDASIRPIGITSVFRRIWAKIILKEFGRQYEEVLTQRHPQTVQLAVGVKGGAMQGGIYVNLLRDRSPDNIHVQLDVKNAFNMVDRTRMMRAVLKIDTTTKEMKAARAALLSFVEAVYATDRTFLTFFCEDGPREFECSTGVTQGCGLGTLLFALTFQDIICSILEEDEKKAVREFKDVFITAYADDGVISGPPQQVLDFARVLGKRCQEEGALEIKEHMVFCGENANVQEITRLGEGLNGLKIEKRGIVFAGNPIGSFEFINEEISKRVAKNEKRLAVVQEFAATEDDATSPFRGSYKHIALSLVSFCCDRRLDFALQVTPSVWIDTRLLVKAQADLWKAVEHISDGEIRYQDLDALGKYLFEAPTRMGGQSWHNLLKEAPLDFVGNVGAHSHQVIKKLKEVGYQVDDLSPTWDEAEKCGEQWIDGIVKTLDEIKTSLDMSDMVGAVANNWMDLLTRSDNLKKGDVLKKWQDATQKAMKAELDTGKTVDLIRAKALECLEEAKSRWRCIEAVQSAIEFVDGSNEQDTRIAGKRIGSNYVSDVALPIILRMHLVQPFISGEGEEDFSFAERMGFQALWDNRRHGVWSTRRRHDAVMKVFGGAMNKMVGPLKKSVFEKDAEFSRSCYTNGGKKHRPDMVLDNALDDNVKFVFDLTNVAPFRRVFADMVIVDDHLAVAEDEKRNSDAWKNFVPNDGMFSEFIPLALGWYGEFGREFKNFVRRIADHYIGDAYARKWRVRRILAQVQVKHLNLIGVYLRNVRAEYEVVGAARKSNRGLPKLILNGRARGINCVEYSSHARRSGSILMAISQGEEFSTSRQN